MVSIFQTASGSWHVLSILQAASWLIGAIVTGGFMFANLRVNRDDRIKAFEKDQQSQIKIAQLEEVTRTKPLKERVVLFLNKLDPTIIPALKNGKSDFMLRPTHAQASDLQSLTAEDVNGTFITFLPSTNVILDGSGRVTEMGFRLTPAVAQ